MKFFLNNFVYVFKECVNTVFCIDDYEVKHYINFVSSGETIRSTPRNKKFHTDETKSFKLMK